MVVQRVKQACVVVDGEVMGAISKGLLVFLGVGDGDADEDVDWLVERLVKLRAFEDEAGRMNESLKDCDGEALVISQFTLFGNMKKGNRPSFNRAAAPELAVLLYESFVAKLSEALGKSVPTGCFGEDMQIEAHNDGPVTLILDSRARDF